MRIRLVQINDILSSNIPNSNYDLHSGQHLIEVNVVHLFLWGLKVLCYHPWLEETDFMLSHCESQAEKRDHKSWTMGLK